MGRDKKQLGKGLEHLWKGLEATRVRSGKSLEGIGSNLGKDEKIFERDRKQLGKGLETLGKGLENLGKGSEATQERIRKSWEGIGSNSGKD